MSADLPDLAGGVERRKERASAILSSGTSLVAYLILAWSPANIALSALPSPSMSFVNVNPIARVQSANTILHPFYLAKPLYNKASY
jgi:hypothetical protein